MKKIRTAKKLISDYITVVRERKALEDREKELKGEIIALMEKDVELLDNYIIRNTPTETNKLDSKKVKAFISDAAIYATLCSKIHSHRFTISI